MKPESKAYEAKEQRLMAKGGGKSNPFVKQHAKKVAGLKGSKRAK